MIYSSAPLLQLIRCRIKSFSLILLTITTPSIWAAVSIADQEAARAEILSGVSEIERVGSPGAVTAFDPEGSPEGQGAFLVTRDSEYRGVIGAAIWGTSRVIAYPHPGYLNFSLTSSVADTGQLCRNSIAWAAQTTDKNIEIITNRTQARDWLETEGYNNVIFRSNWENGLASADLAIINTDSLTEARSLALTEFLRNGGALITGHAGWIIEHFPTPGRSLSNPFLNQVGLGWPRGFFSSVNPIITPTSELGNATAALAAAQEHFARRGSLSDEEITEIAMTLRSIQNIIPSSDPSALSILEGLTDRANLLRPTPANPISDDLDQFTLEYASELLENTPVEEVVAHPTAEELYGTIPSGASRDSRTVTIGTSRNRWQSTGMYAVPGETVTLTFPDALVGKDYHVQLGSHTDRIRPNQRASWLRVPFGVTRRFPITSSTITIAGAFGGAIYIDLGGEPPANLGTFDINTSGAIQAPYFVLGETTNEDWINRIRNYPAPYAELECSGLILSVPSSWIRTINNPEGLMAYWDNVVARQDWVTGQESRRNRPERINIDVQISVGLLHAGYPIQGPDTYENIVTADGTTQGSLVNIERLVSRGDWGWFHELGHEAQRRPDGTRTRSSSEYTFEGGVEVTVNIFANAALEEVVPSPSFADFWSYSTSFARVMERAITTVSNTSTTFDQKDPYPFYFQLADGFGWQMYRDVLSIYTENHESDEAQNFSNEQKKGLWLQRWSQVSQMNMVPYMVDVWKLEVSQAAIDQVNAMTGTDGQPLPIWMPVASTLEEVDANTASPLILELEAAALSLDGLHSLISVNQPSHGAITNNGDGTYTYISDPGFIGIDTFSTTYQSGSGTIKDSTTTIFVSETSDIDHDGLINTQERLGQNALGENTGFGATENSDSDSDNDTFHDGVEVGLGSDPNSASSTPASIRPRVSSVDDTSNFNFSRGDLSLREVVETYRRTTLNSYNVNFTRRVAAQTIPINSPLDFENKPASLSRETALVVAPEGQLIRSQITTNGSLQINGTYVCDLDRDRSSNLTVADNLNIQNATLDFESDFRSVTANYFIIASYGTLTGSHFAIENNVPFGYFVDYSFSNGSNSNNIALVKTEFVFTNWASNFFPDTSNESLIGFDADPNQDGLSNRLTFLFGGDPTTYDATILPQSSLNANDLVVTFRRNDAAISMNPIVAISRDLSNWDADMAGVTTEVFDDFYGEDIAGNGIDKVIVRIPRQNAAQLFSRIELTP